MTVNCVLIPAVYMAMRVAYEGTKAEDAAKARFASDPVGNATVEVNLIRATRVPGVTDERTVPAPAPGGLAAASFTMFAPAPVV